MKAIFVITAWIAAGLCITAHAESLDLSNYPKSDEISYGGVDAQVRPKQYIRYKAPLTGKLYLKVKNGTHQKDTIWAEFEPEQIALEREVMELTKSLNELKNKPMVKLEMADSRAALDNRRVELKRNLAMMREILAEPDLAELYLGNNDVNAKTSHSTIKQMESRLIIQIAAIEQALAFVGTPEQELVELRLADLQIERKDVELKRKEQESKLKFPFSGNLTYLTELPDDAEAPLMMQTGQEIAEIADYSTLECDVVVNRTELRQLPTAALALEFRGQSGTALRANFKMQKNVELFGKNELIYVFEFPEELASAARTLVGGRVNADLIMKLPSEAHLVPKLDLVRSEPDQLREKGWRLGVEAAFPGYRVLSVGQTKLAVFPTSPADE